MKRSGKSLAVASGVLVLGVAVMLAPEFDASAGSSRDPDFVVNLLPVEPDNENTEAFSGKARMWLWSDDRDDDDDDDDDRDGEVVGLKYVIELEGMDVSGFGAREDDVTKIHFHEDGIFGFHALNVYKAPCEDDEDLVVRPTEGIVAGIWDDGDENLACVGEPNVRDGGDSIGLSPILDKLCNDEMYMVIHGDRGIVQDPAFFDDRVLGGQILSRASDEFCDYVSPSD